MKLISINKENRKKIQKLMKKTCWNCHFMQTIQPFYCYKIEKIRERSCICKDHMYFDLEHLETCGDEIKRLSLKK